MDAASDLKRRYDKSRIRALAETKGLKISKDGRIQCPARCSEDPRGATVSDSEGGGVWQCKRCGKGGSVIDLVMAAEGVELPRALEQLGAAPVPAPAAFVQKPPVDGGACWPRLSATDTAGESYLRARGLEAAIPLVKFNIGRTGDTWLDEKAGRGYRVAVPMRDTHGNVGALQVRSVRPDITPKFSKLSLPGPQRKDVAFGHPELARSAARVYVTEGMADTLAIEAAGYPVIGAPGEGQVQNLHLLLGNVAGREFVCCPQNDRDGCDKPECAGLPDCRHRKQSQKAFRDFAGQLLAKGARVATLLPPPGTKDPADWLKAVGIEAFRTACNQVAFPVPEPTGAVPLRSLPGGKPSQLPVIQRNDRQLRDVVADAWGAVRLANTAPSIFIQGGRLVRLQTAGELPRVESISVVGMFGHLARVADWVDASRDGESDDSPSKDVAADMLEYPDPEMPPLDAVITTPVFDAGGRLVERRGYHRQAALWLEPRAGFSMPPVPEHPTDEDAIRARDLLLEELLGDFCFVRESDRAHALAALLLPFCRRFVRGPTPLHLIEAPTPGSGKSLLANLIGIVATGADIPSITITRDEDETRKKITAKLSGTPSLLLIDNVKTGLDSATLASALTSETWEDRPFGQNTRMVVLPNRTVWIVTANNPGLSLEIARRCLRIRLDAKTDRPWNRTGFRHEKILEWAQAHRGALVHAVLTLVRFWQSQQSPKGPRTLGSFEGWAAALGGILEASMVPGLLGDQEELYEAADEEGGAWREFCAAWWERFANNEMKPSQLLDFALERGLLGSVLGDKGVKSQQARLGKALASLRDRQFAAWRVGRKPDSHGGGYSYSLTVAE